MSPIFRRFITAVLSFLARRVVKKYKPKIIAITGSVGKTGTKDAVYAVLREFYHVRKSEKSYNSQIGLPLTILGCNNAWNNKLLWIKNIFHGLWLWLTPHKYPEWLVLEVGIDKPGDMKKKIKSIGKIDIAIFTYFGDKPVHVEFFPNADDVAREKKTLLRALKNTGSIILNADDPKVLSILEKEKDRHSVYTYGFNTDADLVASHYQITDATTLEPHKMGVLFRLDFDGHSIPVTLEGVFGKNYIYAALAGLSVAKALDLNMLTASKSLREYDIQPGRLRLLPGVKETLIIDDSYNSSPAAVELALNTLAEIRNVGNKIAVLGDMLELGKHTEEAHREIGRLVAEKANILVTVGPRSHFTAEEVIKSGMNENNVFKFNKSREAGKFVETKIQPGDCILVKGSQGMRMERAVQEIMAHPEDREELLVRQNPEWLRKE